ncbi:MAG: hypothetical protein AWU58_2112 [Methanohalophilus sp. T328-1]|jgi:hypothetical protein|uniref:DUF531 domain-containing protein n=1 Tax=Methanohalophilus sp. WG1-DM TaxID=2491675 RepID=UPI000797B8E0|nr:DUF531 domain-containing protein [Methanohalophilus sp. WG1-DM]KXS37678.1 MAG: hypothetical protein AWU58_2112 [Methanohalophilus sp. T328-1]RSD33474.1 MAG: hypothetical protein CI953_1544 [Methanohalophilus sp.]RXG34856.1 hypothetical protein CI957_450 [Methanohalophilus sp. WG1-DM]
MQTLGIVNTYDRIKVLDAHYRAIARAAPICKIFGFSLALFDFPFDMEKDELVKYVVEKTTIGESGAYLQQLNEDHHFFVQDLPKKGFPAHFGKPVATTSRADESKRMTAMDAAQGILHHDSYLFLVGLGRKGLPKSIIKQAPNHLDISSEGTSCETCTAMGAIPAYIMGIVEGIKSNKHKSHKSFKHFS